MSLRNEQCNKVCRILDDVLANRPTERDSLITAVRKAFGALETEPQWIPCSEKLPENSSPVLITHRGGVSYGWYNGRYFERGANTNHRKLQTVIAWQPLPEPYREGGEK